MNSEWVTLQKAILRLNFKGVEESAASFGLETAISNGEIATREVDPGLRTTWEATEMVELRSADLDKWMNELLGVKPKNEGGRPLKYDWLEFHREIIRIANHVDGLPESKVALINKMREWTEKNWGKSPGETMLEQHVSAIYTGLKKAH